MSSGTSTSYDAIVIGGGHNGLTCAAYLARAGRKVLVLERRHVLGGAAVSEEVFPGFTYSVCSYVVSLLRPQIIRDLQLPRFGLDLIPLESTFTPLPNGEYLLRTADPEFSRQQIARFSQADAEIYPEFAMTMTRLARFAQPLLEETPADPVSLDPRQMLDLLRLGNDMRHLSADDQALQARLLSMSAVDFLDRWFESDVLKAAMSISGIIGTFLGVRSPGSAYVLLHHYMGDIDGAFRSWGLSRGGTGQVSLSIARSAQHYGAEIRTNASVARIITEDGTARGVTLEDGEEIRANTVVSALDPRRTFFGLVGRESLDGDFVAGLESYKYRGSSAKVNLALDRLPSFSCLPGDGQHLRGDITIAPGIDYLERAYDEAKYGAYSRRPFLDIVIPSLLDPTVAPPGKHVMSIFVQYAPYHLAEGADAWPGQREAFGDTVIDTLEEYCPGLRASILHRQVLTPWDLEQEFGLTEGNIFHGELSAEQLFFQRPVPGWSRYRSPISGLWMCASGTHPGGGVMGAPGYNAARKILGG